MAVDHAFQNVGPVVELSDRFADVDVPPALEESLSRHRRHLAELVRTMKTAGISDRHIEESLSILIAQYKEELVAAIRRLKDSPC